MGCFEHSHQSMRFGQMLLSVPLRTDLCSLSRFQTLSTSPKSINALAEANDDGSAPTDREKGFPSRTEDREPTSTCYSTAIVCTTIRGSVHAGKREPTKNAPAGDGDTHYLSEHATQSGVPMCMSSDLVTRHAQSRLHFIRLTVAACSLEIALTRT